MSRTAVLKAAWFHPHQNHRLTRLTVFFIMAAIALSLLLFFNISLYSGLLHFLTTPHPIHTLSHNSAEYQAFVERFKDPQMTYYFGA